PSSEQHALDERGGQEELEERVDLGEAGQVGGAAERRRVHGGDHQREEEAREPHAWLPERAEERASSERGRLLEHQPGTVTGQATALALAGRVGREDGGRHATASPSS